MKKEKNGVLTVGAIIFLAFFLTGSEYISWWLYRLPLELCDTAVDIVSEVIGYLFQAFGIFSFAFLKKKGSHFCSKENFWALAAVDFAFAAAAFFCVNFTVSLIFGLAMNYMHGMLTAYYLGCLRKNVVKNKRGITFGAAYALGSVATYALSCLDNGGFLGKASCFVVYALITALLAALNCCLPNADVTEIENRRQKDDKSDIFRYAAICVLLISLVKGMGFYFPSIDPLGSVVSAENARAFYAVGLLAAGLVNDKSRRNGAISCLCALVFPFLSFALNKEPNAGVVLWVAGYIFFGFFFGVPCGSFYRYGRLTERALRNRRFRFDVRSNRGRFQRTYRHFIKTQLAGFDLGLCGAVCRNHCSFFDFLQQNIPDFTAQ